MANVVAVIGRYARHILIAGAAVAALASFPALAKSNIDEPLNGLRPAPTDSQTPPDLTLVCTVHSENPKTPNDNRQMIVEIWYHSGRVILNHTTELPAQIDARSIRFEDNRPFYTNWVGVIDRMTGLYRYSMTTTVPGVIAWPQSGQCSQASNRQLF